jgi:hypothetical protein
MSEQDGEADGVDKSREAIEKMLADGADPEIMQMVLDVRIGALEAQIRRDKWCLSMNRLSAGLVTLAAAPDDWKVRSRSEADSDLQVADLQIGNRTESFVGLLRYEASLNMRVAADQLGGLATLVSSQMSAMAAASVARGIFESSTWAAALLDPTVSHRERLRRLLIRRLVRLRVELRDLELQVQSHPGGAASTTKAATSSPDEHGSHLDPEQEAADLEALARSTGWPVKYTATHVDVGGPLSINWLVRNIGKGVGIEDYVWGNASALTHGEHTRTTASLLSMFQDHMDHVAPTWFTQMNTTGSWAGPRLLLATFAAYTGYDHLAEEFVEMRDQFWDNTLK